MTKLQKVREQKNMTAYKLAKESGVKVSTVTNIERGISSTLQMRYLTLMKLANALEVTVDEIVDFE